MVHLQAPVSVKLRFVVELAAWAKVPGPGSHEAARRGAVDRAEPAARVAVGRAVPAADAVAPVEPPAPEPAERLQPEPAGPPELVPEPGLFPAAAAALVVAHAPVFAVEPGPGPGPAAAAALAGSVADLVW